MTTAPRRTRQDGLSQSSFIAVAATTHFGDAPDGRPEEPSGTERRPVTSGAMFVGDRVEYPPTDRQAKHRSEHTGIRRLSLRGRSKPEEPPGGGEQPLPLGRSPSLRERDLRSHHREEERRQKALYSNSGKKKYEFVVDVQCASRHIVASVKAGPRALTRRRRSRRRCSTSSSSSSARRRARR